ncbi:MAG: hypothetical protein HYX72_04315 [Acidobacteria bacterium]|nr:hypothetical protein [Acidobacteriota bacterium]
MDILLHGSKSSSPPFRRPETDQFSDAARDRLRYRHACTINQARRHDDVDNTEHQWRFPRHLHGVSERPRTGGGSQSRQLPKLRYESRPARQCHTDLRHGSRRHHATAAAGRAGASQRESIGVDERAADTIGGQAARVLFSGMAPGFVGLWQVNAEVPQSVTPGPAVPLVISAGGNTSNTVTIAVQ